MTSPPPTARARPGPGRPASAANGPAAASSNSPVAPDATPSSLRLCLRNVAFCNSIVVLLGSQVRTTRWSSRRRCVSITTQVTEMEAPMRRGFAWITLMALLVTSAAVRESAAQTDGQLTIAFDVAIAPTFLDPGETSGVGVPFVFLYALHD